MRSWKGRVLKGTAGSNPVLSAKLRRLLRAEKEKEKPNCFSFSFSSILPRLRYAPECGHRPRDASLCYAIPSRFALLTNPSSSAKLDRVEPQGVVHGLLFLGSNGG